MKDVKSRRANVSGTSPTALHQDRLTFEQHLQLFDAVLPEADSSVREILINVRSSVVGLKSELDRIRIPQPGRDGSRAVCFECGAKNLDVFYTSKEGRYHLCPPCFSGREQRGRARSDR
jgi:hypothetical protein